MKKILYLILSIFLINMFACSKPKEFLVVFDSDGGTLVESVIVLEGEKIVAPVEPTKGNYAFDAWYLGEEKWSFVENVVTEDITLKAKWIINQYTLTFDTNGGSEIEAITQDYNSVITFSEEPIKDGYSFIGWDKEIPEYMPENGLTVKALWQVNQYKITFDTDGGSEIEALTQDYNSVIVLPNNPTKEGYTFKGWDKEIPEKMPSQDIVLKAIWEINKYTITYDLNGGRWKGVPYSYEECVSDLLEDLSKYYGEEVTANNLTKFADGYSLHMSKFFLEDTVYSAKWDWLANFMLETLKNDESYSNRYDFLLSGVNSAWCYEVCGFVNKKQMTSWPYSSDYSKKEVFDKYNNIASDKKAGQAGPTAYTFGEEVELLEPTHSTKTFDYWLSEEGDKYTDEIPTNVFGDLVLKAIYKD